MITAILFVYFVDKPMEALQSKFKFDTVAECEADAENAIQELLSVEGVTEVEYICGELKG